MKTTKHTFVAPHLDTLVSAAGLGKVDPVPTAGAPKRPGDFTPSKSGGRGTKTQPAADLIKASPAASKEIAGSTTYAIDFGSSAPDQQSLATNLAFAAAWSAEYMNAEEWLAYVKEQTRLAWLQTNPLLDQLATPFASALGAKESTIGTRYPSTAKLYDVRREPAVKGAAVKRSKKEANAAATKAKAKVEATTVGEATTGATNGVATADATGADAAKTGNGAAAKN